MALMDWNKELSVNVKEIDAQHKKLVDLINQLYDAMKEGKGAVASGKILSDLVKYTVEHFASEEKLMKQHGYPGYAEQRKAHEDLTRQVIDFKSQYDKGSISLTPKLMTFLRGWLSNHILITDKNYTVFFNGKGVY